MPDFFIVPSLSGYITAKMNPREEKAKIIAEVSGCLDVFVNEEV
jgi:hypothetical protein